jgi:hypothetical protein
VEALHLQTFFDSLLDLLYEAPHASLLHHIQTIEPTYMSPRNHDGMTGSDRARVRQH